MDSLRKPETWAAAAPILCAVHCAATPLLVVFIPALALTPAVEVWLLVLSASLATVVILPGVRVHGRREVLLPVILGLGLWGASLAHWLHPLPEPLVSALGAMSVAGGIYWSARLRHRMECVACEVHGRRAARYRRSRGS